MINKQLTHVQKADSAVYETPSWLGRPAYFWTAAGGNGRHLRRDNHGLGTGGV